MVDEDFVDDFEEEEVLLAHVDANQSWKINTDTLVDRVAGVVARIYEEWLPRDRPEITGEFFPVHSNALIVKAGLLDIEKACVYHEGDGDHFLWVVPTFFCFPPPLFFWFGIHKLARQLQ